MNNRALTLSLAMAVAAFFFIQSYVTSVEDEAKRKFGTEVLVVKAKKDIKEQETLLEDSIAFDTIPKRFLEPSAIRFERRAPDEEANRSLKSLIGTVAVVPIKKGEQISFNKITEPSIRTGLSPQVAPGRRGVSMPVNDVSGVAKLVKPGDRVDIIAVIDLGGGKENKMAKTILQDVVLLAVGRNVTNNLSRLVEMDPSSKQQKVRNLTEDFSFNTVTVEVEPQQAQMLALVGANGDATFILSLRNNDDTERLSITPLMLPDVLGPDSARMAPRAPAAVPQVPGGVRR